MRRPGDHSSYSRSRPCATSRVMTAVAGVHAVPRSRTGPPLEQLLERDRQPPDAASGRVEDGAER
jgi:hypothetical protein